MAPSPALAGSIIWLPKWANFVTRSASPAGEMTFGGATISHGQRWSSARRTLPTHLGSRDLGIMSDGFVSGLHSVYKWVSDVEL